MHKNKIIVYPLLLGIVGLSIFVYHKATSPEVKRELAISESVKEQWIIRQMNMYKDNVQNEQNVADYLGQPKMDESALKYEEKEEEQYLRREYDKDELKNQTTTEGIWHHIIVWLN